MVDSEVTLFLLVLKCLVGLRKLTCLAASLRSDLNNEFPSVDYSRDFNNPFMLKALLFAARARDQHSKSRNLAGGSDDHKTKRARLAEARPGDKGKGTFPTGKGKGKPTTHLWTGKMQLESALTLQPEDVHAHTMHNYGVLSASCKRLHSSLKRQLAGVLATVVPGELVRIAAVALVLTEPSEVRPFIMACPSTAQTDENGDHDYK